MVARPVLMPCCTRELDDRVERKSCISVGTYRRKNEVAELARVGGGACVGTGREVCALQDCGVGGADGAGACPNGTPALGELSSDVRAATRAARVQRSIFSCLYRKTVQLPYQLLESSVFFCRASCP